jgi:uncharacterized protein
MQQRISANTFYQYQSCPLQLWFAYWGDKKKRGSISPVREALMAAGRKHEAAVMKDIGLSPVFVDCEDEQRAFDETLALMKQGKTIYQGTLIDDNWIGRPDLLIPKRGRSRLGAHHYTVEDIKLTADLTDEHRYQLTFYALLLERIQGIRPRYVSILNGERKTIRFDISEFLERFERTLGEIEKILAGEKPPPFLSGSCKDSPWFTACVDEAVKTNDLSLVYKIWRSEYDRLRDVGIKTVNDLARADFFRLEQRVRGITPSRLSRLQQQAIGLVEKTHFVVEQPELPVAAVEVFYDIETDVLTSPPLQYLHGVLIVRRGKKEPRVVYKPFLVRNPQQEGNVWKRFCAFLDTLPKDAVLYHYGRYEQQVIADMRSRYGTPRAAHERFSRMIDLSRVAQRCVLFPTQFYSLKDLAKYLGFHWRHKEASGLNSIGWYQEWRKNKAKAVRSRMLQDILEYNEDDVRATRVLKDFLATVKM